MRENADNAPTQLHRRHGTANQNPFFVLIFSRSGNVDEDGFDETVKHAFPIDLNLDSPACIPVKTLAILMDRFERGQTHFDDGYDQIMASLCPARENAETRQEMEQYFSANMKPANIWTTNTNFGSHYFVFDFKQV